MAGWLFLTLMTVVLVGLIAIVWSAIVMRTRARRRDTGLRTDRAEGAALDPWREAGRRVTVEHQEDGNEGEEPQ